jgi:hypothetical protein
VVDPEAAAAALTRLVADPDLRRRMGAAGRRRVLERFTWERVVRAYEALWADQDREVRAWSPPARAYSGPAVYPAPEQSFAGYPTGWVSDGDLVQASPTAEAALPTFVSLPLTNIVGEQRARQAPAMASLLRAAGQPRPVGELAAGLERTGLDPAQARAAVAWLLKYGLLLPP